MASFRDLRPLALQAGLLVLDEDKAFVQSLSRVLQPNIPQMRIQKCASPRRAQRLLTSSTYQAIICNPSLIIRDGLSVLTRSRSVQPPVPFLLRLRQDEREFARHWLDLGVYDFIFSPIDPAQVLESLQHALVLSKRRARIAHQEQVLIGLRHRRDRYQANNPDSPMRYQVDEVFNGSIRRIEESAEMLKQTVTRVEASLSALQRACHDNELHARERALNRLIADLSR